MLNASNQLLLHNSLSTSLAFAGMQDLAYMGDQSSTATASDSSSRLYETDSGEIYLRPKTPAEVVGERILRPALDATQSFFSKLSSLSRWAWTSLPKGLDIPPFSLPVARAESLSQKEGNRAPQIIAEQVDSYRKLKTAHSQGNTPLVTFYLENGADLNLQLDGALQDGNTEIASLLLENGADPNLQDQYRRTPLHSAAEKGNSKQASLLLANGADPNLQNNIGGSPLYWAVEKENIEMASLLLENGADPNLQDDYRATPLHWAIKKGNTEMASLLLEHGANLNLQDSENWTRLFWAAENRNTEMTSLLLEHGADPNLRDKDNWTPLYRAARDGNTEMASLLIQHGANPNLQTSIDRTPLLEASLRGNTKMVSLLLAKGANPNLRDISARTPLLEAAQKGNTEVTSLLLANGADPNLQGSDGWAPLFYAVWKGNSELASLLLENGADPNLPGMSGWTPTEAARKLGHTDIVELLKTHGAKEPRFPIFTFNQFAIFTACAFAARKLGIQNLIANSLQWAASKTNLHRAAYLNKDASVSALIRRGHSVNAVDATGSTPLHLAMAPPGTGPRARTFFETTKVRSYAMNALGLSRTDYSQASSENTLATANTLLQSRADLSIRNQRGMTPLDMTLVADSPHFPRLQLMDSLIQHGAEQHLEDSFEQTLQHYQENHRCDDIDFTPEEGRLAFEHLEDASERLERDETYPRFVCPITNCHIWDPVLDPTDGKTVYERNAIVQWLQQNPTGLRTRQPLVAGQLIELPTLRNYLQKRAVQHFRESRQQ